MSGGKHRMLLAEIIQLQAEHFPEIPLIFAKASFHKVRHQFASVF